MKHKIATGLVYTIFLLIPIIIQWETLQIPYNIMPGLVFMFIGINITLVISSAFIKHYDKSDNSIQSYILLEILALIEMVLFYSTILTQTLYLIVVVLLTFACKTFLLVKIIKNVSSEKSAKKENKDYIMLIYLLYISGLANIFSFIFKTEPCNNSIIYGFLCSNVCGIMLFNTIIHNILSARNNKIELAKTDLHLKNEEMAVMLSQIKPHFIYNTLNTIQYLCRTDAELAADTISDFSEYLRTNLNFDSNKQIVLFQEELEHINRYLKIEKLRFKHRLKVKYEIQEENFFVPTLSIQPIVENAVKHGISKRLNGGTIIISSYKENDSYIVQVKDNGVGFFKKEKESKWKSLGISNIQNRIRILSGGYLIIESKENLGTIVKIVFPFESNTKEVTDNESGIYR